MMIKRNIELSNSYLNFFYDINLKDVSVFDLSSEKYNKHYPISGDLPQCYVLVTHWSEKKKIQRCIKAIGLHGQIHLIFEPGHGSLEKIMRLWHVWSIKQWLLNHLSANCHWLGVVGSPWNPRLVLPLKKNIVTYVMVVAFRFFDNPFKNLIKKFIVQVFGAVSWSDTIILVILKK